MVHEFVQWFLSSPVLAATPNPGVPNPGLGTAPPGSAGIVTILQWVAYGVSAACVGGILFVSGKMAVQHQRGEAGQHMGGLAMVLFACILAGSAAAIVGALI